MVLFVPDRFWSPSCVSERALEGGAVVRPREAASDRANIRRKVAMSTNKTKKVKMATKSCPECDQQVSLKPDRHPPEPGTGEKVGPGSGQPLSLDSAKDSSDVFLTGFRTSA